LNSKRSGPFLSDGAANCRHCGYGSGPGLTQHVRAVMHVLDQDRIESSCGQHSSFIACTVNDVLDGGASIRGSWKRLQMNHADQGVISSKNGGGR